MGDEETALAGSRLNEVVKIGDTVHRPAGPWTPTVHALLRHVRANGFGLAPEPLGMDDRGREVLSYIPGHTVGDGLPWPAWTWDDELLMDVGRATARYHGAVAGFRPAGVVPWQFGPSELQADQIVCHHDIAPYNVVVADGRLQGIIDWDLIGPGTTRSDLAFVAWQWVPLQHPAVARMFGWHGVDDLARRLNLLLDAYGLQQRDGFIDDVIARMHLNRDGMLRKAAEGVPAYIRLVEAGHVEGMNAAIAFVASQRDALQRQLS
ncbi:MAG: aminoglycoside phosphotransferase family protein [Acidimicrobiaceae bacterium]|nr:aminoglycoside phosphotransferase family protein [Acidimicrobiaceae bacterium]